MKKQIIEYLKKHITFEHCVIRFVMAWCFISFLQAVDMKVTNKISIYRLDYIGHVHFVQTLFIIIAFFIALYVVFELAKKPMLEKIVLVMLSGGYSIFCVYEHADLYFAIGMTGLMIFSICYCFMGVNTEKLQMNAVTFRIIAIATGVCFVIFTGGCTALRYYTYAAPNFDLGLFSQMFHYMKTDFTMSTTCERDGLLSHMCIHISPCFYLMLPAYLIKSSPATLQVMQAVVIALGMIPLVLICKNHKLSRFETLFFVIVYAFLPFMSGGCFYDIHENAFLPLFLLLLLYFIEKDHLIGTIISMALVFSVKEDASIYVAFIALYMIAGLKKYKRGALIFLGSLIYFIFTTVLLSKIGVGVMTYRFNNMIYDSNGSMIGIIKTVILNPAYLVTQIFDTSKITYILQVLVPLCFLPFITKRWQRFILIGPWILFNLMSDYTYFHNINFQYTFGTGVLLLYLAVMNAADLDMKLRSKFIPMAAVASVLIFTATVMPRLDILEVYTNEQNQKTYAILNEALEKIPKDASVTATTLLCPALSDRDVLYELYYTNKSTEYIALDLRTAANYYDVNDYLNNSRYEVIYYSACKIGVFRDTQYLKE
jgi:uncharacterized membrane protein